MPGGLFPPKKKKLRVLSGIGIDSGENLKSFPPAIWIKKNPQTKSVHCTCTVFCGFFYKSCWQIFFRYKMQLNICSYVKKSSKEKYRHNFLGLVRLRNVALPTPPSKIDENWKKNPIRKPPAIFFFQRWVFDSIRYTWIVV